MSNVLQDNYVVPPLPPSKITCYVVAVLDTIEVLFGALDDEAVVRAEFSRLLRWLKDQGLTTLITGVEITLPKVDASTSECHRVGGMELRAASVKQVEQHQRRRTS